MCLSNPGYVFMFMSFVLSVVVGLAVPVALNARARTWSSSIPIPILFIEKRRGGVPLSGVVVWNGKDERGGLREDGKDGIFQFVHFFLVSRKLSRWIATR